MPRTLMLLIALLLIPQAKAELLNDPTRPPLSAPAKAVKPRATLAPAPKLQLNAITYSRQGSGHSAIINGQRVGIGDRIGGATVDDIRQAAVLLTRGKQRITLEFAGGVQKRQRD